MEYSHIKNRAINKCPQKSLSRSGFKKTFTLSKKSYVIEAKGEGSFKGEMESNTNYS